MRVTPPKHEPLRPPDVEVDDEEPTDLASRWKIDRHVPLALIGAILLQSAVAIYWAGSFSASITGRVDVLEKQMAISAPVSERIVRLETKFDSVKETVDKIEALIRGVSRAPAP